jgi:hypothetical protein
MNTNERSTVCATIVASSGATQHVQVGSSSETDFAAKKTTPTDSLVCNKCGKKGHVSKDCAEEVKCAKCGKGHLSSRCAWLK